ncbi:MAG TPA: efflux RND transporter periplasmic adaptor subunit [Candidatus Binataceae bacterium]|nr:efflux RND transporter periplasmic adaptor subunit [Candidatus Binataceae bacterium]
MSSATRVKFRLIAVLALAAAAGACSKGEQTATSAAPAVPVLVAKVEQRNVPNQLQEIGTVEAFSTVNVKARAEGQLVAIHFKEGDYVSKGQLLFNLDPRPLEAALHQAQATLARDQAQDLQAETDEKRYAFLLKEGVGSQQQYDQAHATAGALRATVAADRAAVETARLNLQYAEIHSPIDGRTGNLQVHVGDLIKADADTPMVVINQVQPIYVDFSIPEASLADVRRNMETRQLEVDAAIPGSQDAGEHGVLSFVDNAVDRTTGTILLKGLFQNENRRLWPGQFVSASLTLNWIENALLVPSQAVQNGQQGPFVFVVGSDMKVTTRPIVPGAPFEKDILVRNGLSAGETVVTDGQLRLAPGAAVRIKTSL